MDAIKKKMQSLKSETDNAALRAEELDKEAKEATQRAEKYEENVRETKHLFFSTGATQEFGIDGFGAPLRKLNHLDIGNKVPKYLASIGYPPKLTGSRTLL